MTTSAPPLAGVWSRLRLLPVAVVATVVVRLPFLFWSPDWGGMSAEHCWMVEAARGRADLQAVYPTWRVPLWVVNPRQFRGKFHRGALVMSALVDFVARATGPRLIAVKIVGIAISALTTGLLIWGLQRLWKDRPEAVRAAAFLFVVPVPLYLWSTLLPHGHYTETPLMIACYLPALIAVGHDRLPHWGAVVMGVFGGLLAAYTPPAVALPGAFAMLLLSTAPSLRLALTRSALHGVAAAAAFLVAAPVEESFRRVTDTRILTPDGDGLAGQLRFSSAALLSPDHARAGGAFTRQGYAALFPGSSEWVEWSDALALPLALAMAAALLWLMGTAIWNSWPARGRRTTPSTRLLVFLGWICIANLIGYLLLTYTGAEIGYIIPFYAPVMLAAALAIGAALRPGRLLRLRQAGALLLAGLSLLSLASQVRWNARETGIPEGGTCAGDYFTALLKVDLLPQGANTVAHGVERCRRRYDDTNGMCARFSWHLADPTVEGCLRAPEDQQENCAWAFGARRSERTCLLAELEECDAFPVGVARDACLSGALSGLGHTTPSCATNLRVLCPHNFRDRPSLYTCLERSAYLVPGMPMLPVSAPDAPASCRSWPEPLRAACGAATRDLLRPQRPLACEDVYRERFADELPAEHHLAYEQCRRDVGVHPLNSRHELLSGLGTRLTDPMRTPVSSLVLYPFCAIGVARELEGLECSWRGDAGFARDANQTRPR